MCTVSFLFSDNHLLSEVRLRSRREIFRDVALRVRGWVGLIVRILRFVCLFRIENPEPPKYDAIGGNVRYTERETPYLKRHNQNAALACCACCSRIGHRARRHAQGRPQGV
jgi:hypothetical protein